MRKRARRVLLGTLVFVVIYVLLASLYTRVLTANNPEAKLIQELLAKKYYGEKYDIRTTPRDGRFGWVKPVNITLWIGFNGWAPNPIHGENLSVLPFPFFAEECVLLSSDPEAGATIQVRGETGDRILYEYCVRDSWGQTPCPSGTLFFVNKDR